ncbi:CYTH domain-containing protein [Rhodoflexus caldus]|uniref:CYTH domain-containing protein n=1 Tax=Rhodoflexus caldus TaxID=2891236 RepID=UPI002029D080|nr:CYTH domain-containing protein [Rhodoflexus caldus]
MPVEIERKFLVKNQDWKKNAEAKVFRQGYLCNDNGKTVRVRIAGEDAFITVKGNAQYISRAEFEYAIPVEDALYMLNALCQRPLIEKTRYYVPYKGLMWEIDEFEGDNSGLIIAEVELTDENQEVPLPPWAGAEVTGDERYYNANLVRNPYKNWK